MTTTKRKPKQTSLPILDNIADDLFDDYDECKTASERAAAMRKDLMYEGKVFKDEGGFKVVVSLGSVGGPSSYEDGPVTTTRAAANKLRDAMLDILNGEEELEARRRSALRARNKAKARWQEGQRKQLKADQVELNAAKIDAQPGDTIILKCYDRNALWHRSRGAVQWKVMLVNDDGALTRWGGTGYTSQADAVMYERDNAPGRMIVVKDGKVEVVRAGKPRPQRD